MTKELEEAKEWLKKNIAYYEEQVEYINAIDSDYYDEEIELYKNRIEIFNNILNYIENSIPKKKVEEILNNTEHEICGNDEYLGNRQCIELELLEKVRKELLEDK